MYVCVVEMLGALNENSPVEALLQVLRASDDADLLNTAAKLLHHLCSNQETLSKLTQTLDLIRDVISSMRRNTKHTTFLYWTVLILGKMGEAAVEYKETINREGGIGVVCHVIEMHWKVKQLLTTALYTLNILAPEFQKHAGFVSLNQSSNNDNNNNSNKPLSSPRIKSYKSNLPLSGISEAKETTTTENKTSRHRRPKPTSKNPKLKPRKLDADGVYDFVVDDIKTKPRPSRSQTDTPNRTININKKAKSSSGTIKKRKPTRFSTRKKGQEKQKQENLYWLAPVSDEDEQDKKSIKSKSKSKKRTRMVTSRKNHHKSTKIRSLQELKKRELSLLNDLKGLNQREDVLARHILSLELSSSDHAHGVSNNRLIGSAHVHDDRSIQDQVGTHAATRTANMPPILQKQTYKVLRTLSEWYAARYPPEVIIRHTSDSS